MPTTSDLQLTSNDPLQKLLRESLHLQLLTKSQQTSSLLKRANEIDQEYKAKLHDQVNWKPSGVVTVIHTAEDGTQTTIGMFQELRNRYVKDARRLIRIESDSTQLSTPEPIPAEYVSGQFWLNGKQIFNPEPDYHADPVEQEAIRSYLKRTRPVSLTQQLKQLHAEHILQELLHGDIIWQRV